MRLTASIAGLFVCALVFATSNSQVSAEAPYQSMFDSNVSVANVPGDINIIKASQVKDKKPVQTAEKPKQVEHTIAKGESLSKIAKQYETTWLRLYAKNTTIAHPDVINAGDKLIIPAQDEVLAERALPVPAPVVEPASRKSAVTNRSTTTRKQPAASSQTTYANRGSSAGNTYTYGYCTWYVKNRRPDLPNNLGNADTWVSRARAQGLPTGSAPRVGAVGQRGMHVVYVERVNSDGTIFISEMNRTGWNVTSTRTVPASYFTYIY